MAVAPRTQQRNQQALSSANVAELGLCLACSKHGENETKQLRSSENSPTVNDVQCIPGLHEQEQESKKIAWNRIYIHCFHESTCNIHKPVGVT